MKRVKLLQVKKNSTYLLWVMFLLVLVIIFVTFSSCRVQHFSQSSSDLVAIFYKDVNLSGSSVTYYRNYWVDEQNKQQNYRTGDVLQEGIIYLPPMMRGLASSIRVNPPYVIAGYNQNDTDISQFTSTVNNFVTYTSLQKGRSVNDTIYSFKVLISDNVETSSIKNQSSYDKFAMKFYQGTSDFRIQKTLTILGPEYTMNVTSKKGSATYLIASDRLQDYNSVTINFELYIDGNADALWFFMGKTTDPSTFGAWCKSSYEFGTETGMHINFQVYDYWGRGVWVVLPRTGEECKTNQEIWGPQNKDVKLDSIIGSDFIKSTWVPVTIKYTKGTSETWKVTVGGKTATYSDPLNSQWILNSGNLWGFGCRVGEWTGTYKLRNIQVDSQ